MKQGTDVKAQPTASQPEVVTAITKALELDTPHIYFNGFLNGLSLTDVIIVLQQNTRPIATLNASFTTIKSFAVKLQELIAQFEKATGQTIMTAEFISEKQVKKNGG